MLSNRDALIVSGLLLVALLFGGGGSPAPLSELIVQLATAIAILVWMVFADPRRGSPGWAAWLIVFFVLAVPILQLVPLPPAVWQSLPGRDVEFQALSTIGEGGAWKPLSMAPTRTLASLLALAPPLALLIMTATLPPKGKLAVVATVVVAGILTTIVGAAQLADGSGTTFRPYAATNLGWLTGFQANRNATVDVILIAILATAAAITVWRQRGMERSAPGAAGVRSRSESARRRTSLLWAAALLLPMTFAAVLTGSRAGIALLVPVLAVAAFMLFDMSALTLRRAGVGFIVVAAIVAGALLVLPGSPRISGVVARFAGGEDFRLELWTDTLYAIRQHWPWGGGLGTFQPLMVAAERLEVVDQTTPNRAHNDYLELALEAGIPGLLAWAGAAMTVAWCAVRRIRASHDPASRVLLYFATAGCTVIALHSFVDYPLRSISLACLMAICAGILTTHVNDAGERREALNRT